MKLQRSSNFELLRILAMIMIVFHHLSVHGGIDVISVELSVNKLWIQFIAIGGKIGVNLFILITGYFLIDNDKIKLKKVFKLLGQVIFYSIAIFLVVKFLNIYSFNLKDIIKVFFPITFSLWWFATAYFLLYIISPYINKLLKSMNKNEYKNMLIIFAFLWCVLPTFTSQKFLSNELVWFVNMYCIGSYIKLWCDNKKINSKKCLLISNILIILTFLSVIFFDIIGQKYQFFSSHATYFYGIDKLPIFLISIYLFIAFKNINIKNNKFINLIASATFGVYLIHDNRFLSTFIWKNIFNIPNQISNNLCILYTIIVVLIVYVCCTIIDIFRIYTFEKYFLKFYDKIINKYNINKKLRNYKLIDKLYKQL